MIGSALGGSPRWGATRREEDARHWLQWRRERGKNAPAWGRRSHRLWIAALVLLVLAGAVLGALQS